MKAQLGTTPFAVVDLETTGIYPGGNDRVIEIAILCYHPGTAEIDAYVTLVKPLRDIGRTDLHGIGADETLHAPTFADVASGARDSGRLLRADAYLSTQPTRVENEEGQLRDML